MVEGAERRREAGRDGAKKRLRSKSVRRAASLSPFQERLKDTDCYTRPHLEAIAACTSVKERLLLVNSILSEDVTDICRAWPMQLRNKDSRIRRELSEKGREHFVKGEDELALQHYNRALLFSSGKGIAHTLARRAAFFLSTGEPHLALRDLSTALEYGCLQTELLDFLLAHHTPATTSTTSNNNGIRQVKRQSRWADQVRSYLDTAVSLKTASSPEAKRAQEDILNNIVQSIQLAAKELDIEANLEVKELEVPDIKERNPLCPAYSEAAAVCYHEDKGRMVKARRDIKAGELICVDSPAVSLLCPDKQQAVFAHCLDCFRRTRAPLPCDNCCTVVFCSKECKKRALNTYHKFECQMRLYEMYQNEGRDVFGLFMALRAVTQKPMAYFVENQKEIEKFIDLEEPVHPLPGRAYLSADYRTVANLATHLGELEEETALKHSVLAVFFLRFLKFAGYFGSQGSSGNLKGQRSLGSSETFILRLLHQIVNVQAFNSHSVHTVSNTASFDWERVGTSLNPSLALVNHSCDANSIRANVNKSSILVAARHIPQGQEITDAYTVHFRNDTLHDRQYHTLKNYMFSCECEACAKNWPLESDIPDELPRIPNFDQEVIYVKRQGDKKEIVEEIIRLRRNVELCMTSYNYAEALEAYQKLCVQLEEHVRKPHAYFLQARAGISHCIWNLYCRQQKVIDDDDSREDVTGRDHVLTIYKSGFAEKIEDNTALELGESSNNISAPVDSLGKDENKKLIESIKTSIQSNALLLSEIKTEQENLKESDSRRNKLTNIQQSNPRIKSCIDEKKALETGKLKQMITETERPVLESEKEVDNIQKEIKERKKKEWEEKEKQRKAMQEERRIMKEKIIEEKLQKQKEEEKLKREKRLKEDELMRKQKEKEFLRRQEEEKRISEELRIEREHKKKQEDAELEELLMSLELQENDSKFELDLETPERKKEDLEAENSEPQIEKTDVIIKENFCVVKDILYKPDSEHPDENKNSLATEVNHEVPITHLDVKLDNLPNNAYNVWSALREIRESKISAVDIFINNKETVDPMTTFDLESLIQSISEKVARKKHENGMEKNERKILNNIPEELESMEVKEIISDNAGGCSKESRPDMGMKDRCIDAPLVPFDYENWSKEINLYFKNSAEEEKPLFEKEMFYLNDLKKKIDEKIKNEIRSIQQKDVNLIQSQRKEKNLVSEIPAAKVDEYSILKMKEKERKRKKKEEKFKVTEEKIKDMKLKTLKIEKISVETVNELKQMKEKSQAMVLKSRLNEKEFQDIFKGIQEENISRKKIKDEELVRTHKEEQHWTEEESNKWPMQTANLGVSNALSMLKAAAQGKSGLSESFKDSIHTCKTLSSNLQSTAKPQRHIDIINGTRHLTPHSSVDLLKNELEPNQGVKNSLVILSDNGAQAMNIGNKLKTSYSMPQKEESEKVSKLLEETNVTGSTSLGGNKFQIPLKHDLPQEIPSKDQSFPSRILVSDVKMIHNVKYQDKGSNANKVDMKTEPKVKKTSLQENNIVNESKNDITLVKKDSKNMNHLEEPRLQSSSKELCGPTSLFELDQFRSNSTEVLITNSVPKTETSAQETTLKKTSLIKKEDTSIHSSKKAKLVENLSDVKKEVNVVGSAVQNRAERSKHPDENIKNLNSQQNMSVNKQGAIVNDKPCQENSANYALGPEPPKLACERGKKTEKEHLLPIDKTLVKISREEYTAQKDIHDIAESHDEIQKEKSSASDKKVKHPVIIHTVTPTSFISKCEGKSLAAMSSSAPLNKLKPSSSTQCYSIESLPAEVASIKISAAKASPNINLDGREAADQRPSLTPHAKPSPNISEGGRKAEDQRPGLPPNSKPSPSISEGGREAADQSLSLNIASTGVKRPPPPKCRPPPPPPIF